MKKLLITALLATFAFSSTAHSHDAELLLLGAGLLGLGIAIGDGNTSFGVHFSNGYYNYQGQRYRSRIDYLRAVHRYEARRRYLDSRSRYSHPSFNGRTISITHSINSRSSNDRTTSNSRNNSSDRFDRDDRSRSDSRTNRGSSSRSSSAASFALRSR